MTEVKHGTAPIISSDASELKQMVTTLENIGQMAMSVMISVEQFKGWLKRELKNNLQLAKAMAENKNVQHFIENTKEKRDAL